MPRSSRPTSRILHFNQHHRIGVAFECFHCFECFEDALARANEFRNHFAVAGDVHWQSLCTTSEIPDHPCCLSSLQT